MNTLFYFTQPSLNKKDMINNMKFFWEVLKETFIEWNKSTASENSASLAYYAIFSIPELLIIIIYVDSRLFLRTGSHTKK